MNHSFLTESPMWTTAGWTMLHLLWVGAVLGLLAAAVSATSLEDGWSRYSSCGCARVATASCGFACRGFSLRFRARFIWHRCAGRLGQN